MTTATGALCPAVSVAAASRRKVLPMAALPGTVKLTLRTASLAAGLTATWRLSLTAPLAVTVMPVTPPTASWARTVTPMTAPGST